MPGFYTSFFQMRREIKAVEAAADQGSCIDLQNRKPRLSLAGSICVGGRLRLPGQIEVLLMGNFDSEESMTAGAFVSNRSGITVAVILGDRCEELRSRVPSFG